MSTHRIVINAGQEQVHHGADPAELPPLDVPEATEPPHWGRTFAVPSKWGELDALACKRRERREALAHRVERLVWIAVAAAIAAALLPVTSGG